GWIKGKKQAAAAGFVDAELSAADPGHSPAPRVQKADAQVGIVVQEYRIVIVGILTNVLEHFVIQVRRGTVGLARQNKSAFHLAELLAVLVEQKGHAFEVEVAKVA